MRIRSETFPRRVARPRREVHPAVIAALRPALRHSDTRDAYVLRGIGHRAGPVLRPRLRP